MLFYYVYSQKHINMHIHIEKEDIVLAAVILLHLSLCPYTKVEESFNLQGVHDVLFHGTSLSHYDHNAFPGVVPRTFMGILVLSCLSSLPIFFFDGKNHGWWSQWLVRMMLGMLFTAAFGRFRRAVRTRFNATTSRWMLMLIITSFHVPFYASRTLPNTFAFVIMLLAFADLLLQHNKRAIVLVITASVIFRSELVLFAGPLLLHQVFVERSMSFSTAFMLGMVSGITTLIFSTCVDSIFWGRLLWPEGAGLWFNVVANRSSDYGTEPWAWYFYSALPRSCLSALSWAALGIASVPSRVLIPTAVFVILYSFLPHKELRFIIYVVPLIAFAGALGIVRVLARPSRFSRFIVWILVIGSLVVNVMVTMFMLQASYWNYPGGVAFQRLHDNLNANFSQRQDTSIHIGEAAAQTGVTRFLENSRFMYSKEENLSRADFSKFDFLLVGDQGIEINNVVAPRSIAHMDTHVLIDQISCFFLYEIRELQLPYFKRKILWPQLLTQPSIFILKNKSITNGDGNRQNIVVDDNLNEEL